MTVLHLAARFGHVDVLEVLRGKVPWSMASVKVKKTNKKMQTNFYCIRYYDTMIFWLRCNFKGHPVFLRSSVEVWRAFSPLHPNIGMRVLHTLVSTFPEVLIRRIC